jgi:hypothetical protein
MQVRLADQPGSFPTTGPFATTPCCGSALPAGGCGDSSPPCRGTTGPFSATLDPAGFTLGGLASRAAIFAAALSDACFCFGIHVTGRLWRAPTGRDSLAATVFSRRHSAYLRPPPHEYLMARAALISSAGSSTNASQPGPTAFA